MNVTKNLLGIPVKLGKEEVSITSFAALQAEFPFDPTYGFTLQDLKTLVVEEEAPADFESFWTSVHEQVERIPLEMEFRDSPLPSDSHRIREVYFTSHGLFRIGAWLCEPRDGSQVNRVEVIGHGYGGRDLPGTEYFCEAAIQLFVCAPGFGLSKSPGRIPSDCSSLHVLSGIHSRETYVLLSCAAAYWSAARAMDGCFEGLPIVYRGTSFGGGIGTLMLPWEPRYRAAELIQPTFGYHSFRLVNRCIGSGDAVRRIAELTPLVQETLRYYDAAFAARLIRVPTLAGVCAFDPAVPPPGQFAIANSIPREFRNVSLFSTGHHDLAYPGREFEEGRHKDSLCSFLNLVIRPQVPA